MKKQSITKDTNVMKIVEKYPEAVPILAGYGLHCVGCYFSDMDTLESGAKIHGLDDETIEMMIKDVNDIIEESKKKG